MAEQRSDSEDAEFSGPQGLDAVPSLARLALTAWWHTTGWALRGSLRAPRLAVEVVLSPPRAVELIGDLRNAVAEVVVARTPLSDDDIPPDDSDDEVLSEEEQRRRTLDSLRDEGQQLLRRSRDVRYEVAAHPAYERILTELAPDEGRILRLLLLQGPQPSVDVRTGGPMGMVHSRLIAPGLSMIGARAGCRYVERVPSYLNNLFRLGMVWFSRETLHDQLRYQVLEAQPEVLEAIHGVRQAKLVRRSIHLTPFGQDFCTVCLAPDAQELGELPEHSTPPSTANAPGPPSDAAREM